MLAAFEHWFGPYHMKTAKLVDGVGMEHQVLLVILVAI
jgi:hypothetical protein